MKKKENFIKRKWNSAISTLKENTSALILLAVVSGFISLLVGDETDSDFLIYTGLIILCFPLYMNLRLTVPMFYGNIKFFINAKNREQFEGNFFQREYQRAKKHPVVLLGYLIIIGLLLLVEAFYIGPEEVKYLAYAAFVLPTYVAAKGILLTTIIAPIKKMFSKK